MRKFTFFILIFMGLLIQWDLCAQTTLVGNTLILPTGQVRLKTLFSSISNQTGFVFSYDATKINDKKLIFIDKSNVQSLETVLTKILPPDIRYKTIEKYIVLYKKSSKVIPDTPYFTNRDQTDIKYSKPILADLFIPVATTTLTDTLPLIQIKTPLNSNKVESIPGKRQMSFETTYNSHLMHLSLLMGEKTFYGKATICYDYYQSFHLGLGAGININFTPSLGLSVDISQYALVFGKTKKMNINTYTTELNPLFSYSFNKRFKLKAGPSVYRIQSNLSTKNKNIDLGSYLGCNATIGIQIRLL